MSKRDPFVSIGMPVYNGERYLAEAIESLLAQTYTDFELIISDNTSTDGTADICHRYAGDDGRIRYVRQKENRGAIWNFNRVFELSRGTYYRWHAHDDICAPDFLACCIEMLDSDPTIVSCDTQRARIDQNGLVLGVLSQQGDISTDCSATSASSYEDQVLHGRQSPRPHQRFRTVLLGPSCCLDCFGLIRSNALRKTRLILPFYGSEKILSAELGLLGRHGRVLEVLFFVRDHITNVDSRDTAEQQQRYVSAASHRQFCPTRLKLIWGHASAVWRSRLSPFERMRCFGVVLQYILQIRKWKRVLTEMLTGAPIRNGARMTLVPPPEPVTVRQILEHSSSAETLQDGCFQQGSRAV